MACPSLDGQIAVWVPLHRTIDGTLRRYIGSIPTPALGHCLLFNGASHHALQKVVME